MKSPFVVRPRHALPIFLSVAACATTSTTVPAFDFTWRDDPATASVHLQLTADERLCLTPAHWPHDGKLDFGKDRVWLVVGEQRFHLADWNGGYCPGCAVEVRAGSTIYGHLSYADFGLPDDFRNLPKTLNFTPAPSRCD